VATAWMPRAVISRTSDSSPATRNESSFVITSAATFFPAKLTAPASSDLKVEVNLTAAESVATAAAIASVVNAVRLERFIIIGSFRAATPESDQDSSGS